MMRNRFCSGYHKHFSSGHHKHISSGYHKHFSSGAITRLRCCICMQIQRCRFLLQFHSMHCLTTESYATRRNNCFRRVWTVTECCHTNVDINTSSTLSAVRSRFVWHFMSVNTWSWCKVSLRCCGRMLNFPDSQITLQSTLYLSQSNPADKLHTQTISVSVYLHRTNVPIRWLSEQRIYSNVKQ
jgi:hypothetical protein